MAYNYARSEELTARELTVLMMLADGMTVREIGLEFNRSYNTIKHNISNIRWKLGARNMHNAIALAYQRGILIPAMMTNLTPQSIESQAVPARSSSVSDGQLLIQETASNASGALQ